MSVDTIGDFLTIIRNGVRASKPFVFVPFSNFKQSMVQIFKDEGFIRDFKIEDLDGLKTLKIIFKYHEGASVIHEIKRTSTPGLRVYAGYKNFKPVIGGLGISVMTTSQGVMTDKMARHLHIGGEVICSIW